MNHQASLEKAIALTDEILQVLEAGEFGRIDELDSLRQPLIKQAFNVSIEEINEIKARHLQNLNQQVVTRLTLFKDTVMGEQKRIRNASKGALQYQKNNPSIPF